MIWCYVIGGLVLVAAAWLGWRKWRPVDVGFRAVVRSPRLARKEEQRWQAQRGEAAELAGHDPRELVGMLLDEKTERLAEEALQQAGPAVVPHLIAALSDPAYRKDRAEPAENPLLDVLQGPAPVATVMRVLESYAPPEAVAALAPLAKDPREELRKQAALLLGMIASDEAIEPLAGCLRDEDDRVRTYAMMGLLRALEAERGSSRFRADIYAAVLPLFGRRVVGTNCEVPRCLLGLDRERAIRDLTSEAALAPDREEL